MIIENHKLTNQDIGRIVVYKDGSAGKIKCWNEQWVFVVYVCASQWNDYQNYTGCATDPKDLRFAYHIFGEKHINQKKRKK